MIRRPSQSYVFVCYLTDNREEEGRICFQRQKLWKSGRMRGVTVALRIPFGGHWALPRGRAACGRGDPTLTCPKRAQTPPLCSLGHQTGSRGARAPGTPAPNTPARPRNDPADSCPLETCVVCFLLGMRGWIRLRGFRVKHVSPGTRLGERQLEPRCKGEFRRTGAWRPNSLPVVWPHGRQQR